MCRLGIYGVFVVAFTFGVLPKGDLVPAVTLSVVGAVQTNSPLHVAGFDYKTDSVQISLLNSSDKLVSGATIVGTIELPPGCEKRQAPPSFTARKFAPLRIAPRGTGITPRNTSPFGIAHLVMIARDMRSIYLQTQVAVTEVTFADGSSWTQAGTLLRAPSEWTTVTEKACHNGTAIAALEKVERVGF